MTIKMGNYEDDKDIVDARLYSHLTSVTIANTTNELSLLTAPIIIPANTLTTGASFELYEWGFVGSASNPDTTINIKLNSSVIVTNTSNMASIAANSHQHIEFLFTIRTIGTSGTFIGQGWTLIKEPTLVGASISRALVMTTTTTIDTTVNNTLDLTYKWGTASASNTITATNASLERVY